MESTKVNPAKHNTSQHECNTDFFALVINPRRLAAQLKFIDNPDQLKVIKKTLDDCFEARASDLAAAAEEQFKKTAQVDKFKKMMAEQGLSMEDLTGKKAEVKTRKYSKRGSKANMQAEQVVQSDGRKMNSNFAVKYEFTDADGNTQGWHGRGRRPERIKELIEQGAIMEDFLISTERATELATA